MLRYLFACVLLALGTVPAVPSHAEVKIVLMKARSGTAHGYVRRRHRHPVAFAVPRCRMIGRSSYQVHWRGLSCPKIAWAGSAPRQPWSYEVFRRSAEWDQRSELWQSHFHPSATHPTIYWGY